MAFVPGMIGKSVSRRSALAIDFGRQLSQLNHENTLNKGRLLEAVPDRHLRGWASEALDYLFQFGIHECKIEFGEGLWGDITHIRETLDFLLRLWPRLLTIEIIEYDSFRARVIFKALM
jgi:hypothetical protein